MAELPIAELPVWQQVTPLSGTLYKVDIDAPGGAQIRHTGDGMAVYMLHSDPGVYLNDHAKRVPEVIAAQAGFDVEHWGRLRKRAEAKRKANEAIDAEFAVTTQKRVVVAHEEYSVTEVQPGVCYIEFDGEPLNARPVPLEMALRRFEELTGVSPAADASQPADADVERAGPKKAK